MQLIIITCALLAACAVAVSFANAFITDNSSYNNTSIRFNSQSNFTRAPVNISAGTGYYSSHPIPYNSAIGSRTQIADKGSSSSLNRVVQSANEISGSAEFIGISSSYSQGDSKYTSITTTQMKIDETVTDGRVHIGALQKDSPSGQMSGLSRIDPPPQPWKNPILEMEEDYIGTYQISKNMTINSSYSWTASRDSWLWCCLSDYDDILGQNSQYGLPLASADEVFGYYSAKPIVLKAKR